MTAHAKSTQMKTASSRADMTAEAGSKRLIRSSELLNGQREVLIEHAGDVYSLRHTSKGKLILTK